MSFTYVWGVRFQSVLQVWLQFAWQEDTSLTHTLSSLKAPQSQHWGPDRGGGGGSREPEAELRGTGRCSSPVCTPGSQHHAEARWPRRRAYRNPRVLKEVGGDIAPGRAGGFGFQPPPVSSVPLLFAGPSAFLRGLCGREGKEIRKDSSRLINEEYTIWSNILEMNVVKV